MNEQNLSRWLERAEHQLRLGNIDAAIDMLRQALSVDPEYPDAHALLALCLLDRRRIHAALHEAKLALQLAPQLALAHYAMAQTLIAHRQFVQAGRQIAELLELDPNQPAYYRLQAQLYQLTHQFEKVLPTLAKALELDPEDPDTIADQGEHYLQQGELAQAEQKADEALQLQPDHYAGLVLKGRVLLHQGQVAEAREHALWALRQDPLNPPALHLLTAVKARSNPFLGLWWRYNSWMTTLGAGRSILVLLGAYLLYRIATIMAFDWQRADLANVISILWLAVVIYTWIGPTLFQKALRKELAGVTLDKNF